MQHTLQNNSSPFKEKHTKYSTYINNNKNNINGTLDDKHQEKVQEFLSQENSLVKKKKKLTLLKQQLNKLDQLQSTEINNNILTQKFDIKNNIENLELEINKLDNHQQEIDYYNSTMDLLSEYYSIQSNTTNNDDTVIDIYELFNKKNITTTNLDKAKLYEKYMKTVYNTPTHKHKNIYPIKICPFCKIEKILHVSEGFLTCTKCGDSERIYIEIDKPTNKEFNIDAKASAYKRANHLSEILNQFQAKESTEIDTDIYDKIKIELKIRRITDYSTLNHKIMKKILKNLKLNKYYEHIHHIINNLNGLPPPTMTREQEENIKRMFKEIQKPFMIFRPKKRKNFLNYNYIIHKICELLAYDEFLPHFPLLKSRVNLEEQDIVWEKICNFKQYQFIPSI